eukprot:2191908-Rhodomonas_salina.2
MRADSVRLGQIRGVLRQIRAVEGFRGPCALRNETEATKGSGQSVPCTRMLVFDSAVSSRGRPGLGGPGHACQRTGAEEPPGLHARASRGARRALSRSAIARWTMSRRAGSVGRWRR